MVECASGEVAFTLPEVLRRPHAYAVIMSYADNLKELGRNAGKPRPSFYSLFAINAGIELYRAGVVQKLIISGSTTFGGSHANKATQVWIEAFTKHGVLAEDIILLRSNRYTTAAQIQDIADFQRKNDLASEPFLILAWDFHERRLRNHMEGFNLNGDIIDVKEVHKYLKPQFNQGKLERILPKEFEDREILPRLFSQYDRKGYIPRIVTLFKGGHVNDIKKVRDTQTGHVSVQFLDTLARKRVKMHSEIPGQ